MGVSDAKRLKELEAENARLKKLLAEQIFENETGVRVHFLKRGKNTLVCGRADALPRWLAQHTPDFIGTARHQGRQSFQPIGQCVLALRIPRP